jgi:hypothetical protein
MLDLSERGYTVVSKKRTAVKRVKAVKAVVRKVLFRERIVRSPHVSFFFYVFDHESWDQHVEVTLWTMPVNQQPTGTARGCGASEYGYRFSLVSLPAIYCPSGGALPRNHECYPMRRSSGRPR